MSPRRKSGLSPQMWRGDFGVMVPAPALTGLDLRRARRWMDGHPSRFAGRMSFWRSVVVPVEAPRPEDVARAFAHPKREATAARLILARKLQNFADGLFGPGVIAWEVRP